MSGSSLITAPVGAVVSTADAKTHLRVDLSDATNDAYIDALVASATMHTQNITGKKLLTQTWDVFYDQFYDFLSLNITPIQSVTHVKYYDSLNALQTLSASEYEADFTNRIPYLRRSSGGQWPVVYDRVNCVSVRIVAGYGTYSSVPAPIVLAIKLLVAHWYEHREAISQLALQDIPLAYTHLLADYTDYGF